MIRCYNTCHEFELCGSEVFHVNTERLCIVLLLESPVVPVPVKSSETPAVKKKHRRAKTGARNHDASADAGIILAAD